MNRQRTPTLTHFGPLFLTALGGWMAFHLANSGSLYIVPGVIVALLLAYGGSLIALRMQTVRDRRIAYPTTRTTGRIPTVSASHRLARYTSHPAFHDMDIAAGD